MFKPFYSSLDNLTKNQKASLVSFVKIFIKKHSSSSSVEEIWVDFVEDIEYDFAIDNPKFPWIKDFLYETDFEKDIKTLIKYTLQQKVYKEKQKPYIEKKKAIAKAARKKATEWRQSREKPTKKQISYYNALCDKKRVEKVDLSEKSKLDLKNMISKLLENSDEV